MTTKTSPIYVGEFSPLVGGTDKRDLGLGMTAELDDGDTISSVVVTVTNADDEAVAAISGDPTVDPDAGVSFRFEAPAASGAYTITAVFTLADGQVIHKEATISIV